MKFKRPASEIRRDKEIFDYFQKNSYGNLDKELHYINRFALFAHNFKLGKGFYIHSDMKFCKYEYFTPFFRDIKRHFA